MADDDFGPWIGWNGGECPVEPDAVVQVVGRGAGEMAPCRARILKWSDNVAAYRVKLEPVVETLDCRLYVGGVVSTCRATLYGTVQVRDGKPDTSTFRWANGS